jgi:hypothetical protein
MNKVDANGVLEKLYYRLASSGNISDLRFPSADVFYVRAAILARTGSLYPVEHVLVSMYLEGYLPPESLNKIPKWYVDQFMGGEAPNMQDLKERIGRVYRQRIGLERLVTSPESADPAEVKPAGDNSNPPWN